MANFAPPPGTSDICGAEVRRFRALENSAAKVFSAYNYGELRTPVFEYTEVFTKGLGNDTEVVQKEMYTFADRGGRSLTLRPEGTAGVMRSLLNTEVMNGVEERVYYCGPMFRGERPAAGRKRQFHQIGVENVGRVAPELDAECIAMLMHFIDEIKITGATLKINTRGVMSDRPAAADLLRRYFEKHLDAMCPDCRERFKHNIWRILDCKQEACRSIVAGAPDYVSAYSDESKRYFDTVCETLTAMNVPFTVDRMLVRGLDYYVHSVFELTHSAGLGAQNAIAGGGRYELFLPGQPKPVKGVGFAAGMERLILTQEALNVPPPEEAGGSMIYLAGLGSEARKANMVLADVLRRSGRRVALEVEEKSFKSQMRAANRLGAAEVVIRGDDELARGVVAVKDMASGEQIEMQLKDYMKKC